MLNFELRKWTKHILKLYLYEKKFGTIKLNVVLFAHIIIESFS